MHVVICEDEPNIAEAVKHKLTKKYDDLMIDIFTSGEKLMSAFKTIAGSGNKPLSASSRKKKCFCDLLILDVMMPCMDGFEVANRLRAAGDESIIIFLTGNEDQVFDAFKVEAFRYLIKPVDEEKLYEAVDAARKKLYENKPDEKKYLYIQNGGTVSRVEIKDIIFAETYNRKITLHTTGGMYDYYGKMSELFLELGDDFFNSHRSYIVSLSHIEGYNAHEIRLDDGSEAILSRSRYSEFVKAYARFIRG